MQQKANAASQAVSADCLNAFRTAILNAHNTYRSQHRVGPLTQSASIGNTAQAYANYLAANNLFKHSGAQDLGENLAMSGGFQSPTVAQCGRLVFLLFDFILIHIFMFTKFLHMFKLRYKIRTNVV